MRSYGQNLSLPSNPWNGGGQNSVVHALLQQQTAKEEEYQLNIENKRMKYIKNLSLAERLGLVERP
jgi:hypothetical protein